MKILAIGQVENDKFILDQINKQTVKPTNIAFYTDLAPEIGVEARRIRIAENHQELRNIVKVVKPDLVWQIEQDAVLPDDCLERLIARYRELEGCDFGYVSGIQIGRHGIYCIGAWKVGEDEFTSINKKLKGIQEVDATGFYCLLAPTDVWLSGIASWNGEPWGPDVNWGLSINKKKYVDMDLHIGHKTKSGIINVTDISTENVRFYKDNGRWNFKTFS
jgi:hypothetical protein